MAVIRIIKCDRCEEEIVDECNEYIGLKYELCKNCIKEFFLFMEKANIYVWEVSNDKLSKGIEDYKNGDISEREWRKKSLWQRIKELFK